jgi:hypothetical protein
MNNIKLKKDITIMIVNLLNEKYKLKNESIYADYEFLKSKGHNVELKMDWENDRVVLVNNNIVVMKGDLK